MQSGSEAERPTTAALRVGANVGRQGIAILLSLLFTVMWARTLGADGTGKYALALLLPALLTTFLNLGLPSAQVFFLGQGTAGLRATWLVVLPISAGLSGIGILVGAAIIYFGSQVWFSHIAPSALWLSLATFPLMLMHAVIAGFLQALEDFSRLNRVLLTPPAMTLVASAAAITLGRGNLETAVIAFLIGQLMGLFAAFRALSIHLGRDRSADPLENLPASFRRQLVAYGLKAYMSNALTFINYRADLFIVNAFLAPTATGLYVVSTQLAERTWVFSYAVSTVMFPKLTQRHLGEEQRDRLTSSASTWTLVVSAALAGALGLVALPLIETLFGAQYARAADALTWLLPGMVLTAMARVLANGIAARGRPGLNLATAAAVATLNVLLNLALVPRLGIVGAALATSCAYATHAVLTVWLFSRLTGTPWWRCFTTGRVNS